MKFETNHIPFEPVFQSEYKSLIDAIDLAIENCTEGDVEFGRIIRLHLARLIENGVFEKTTPEPVAKGAQFVDRIAVGFEEDQTEGFDRLTTAIENEQLPDSQHHLLDDTEKHDALLWREIRKQLKKAE